MDEQTIGANIRRTRQAAGLTVTALAARSQLTKSTLSKVEKGQISSPISTFMRIAEALSVPVADFFVEQPAAKPFVLTRKGDATVITRDGSRFGYAYEALALDMRNKLAEPFVLTICPGDPAGEFSHGGEEFIYMLSGRMEFTVGEHRMILRAGDSLYFDPTNKHTTKVLGKRPARFVCVFIGNRP
ncbi:MAG: cupin domain-containing protein [Pirellulales bacterium]|nr:cupin domain-containing protein [Pirellulales bacterium]